VPNTLCAATPTLKGFDMSDNVTCQHCGKVIYFSPKLKKWVTHRVGRRNRDKIIDTWKCGNDPASPVKAHSPKEQEQAA
jgi:hypothetical protein